MKDDFGATEKTNIYRNGFVVKKSAIFVFTITKISISLKLKILLYF